MRRYGDNVTPDDELEEETREELTPRVLYGGCGVRLGSLPAPVQRPHANQKSHRSIWSLFDIFIKKTKEEK